MRDDRAFDARDGPVLAPIRIAPALAQFPCGVSIDLAIVSDNNAVDLARRGHRHAAILDDIGPHFLGIALERIAESACRGPDDGVDVGRVLHEVLLAQAQRDLGAVDLADVARYPS